jgi:hypothetical protein
MATSNSIPTDPLPVSPATPESGHGLPASQTYSNHSQHGGTEPDNVKLSGIVVFGTAFVIASALILVSIYAFLRFMERYEKYLTPAPVAQQVGDRPIPPEPRLQPEEDYHESLDREDLAALHAQEQTTLTSYGWVDQGKGIVRLPLSKAIQFAVANGLPATLPPIGSAPTNSEYAPSTNAQPLPQNPK